jgi:soluble lytic murein transglycosylase-like protein
MEITSDLAAVTRRMREIADLSPAPSETFDNLVKVAFDGPAGGGVATTRGEIARLIRANAAACGLDPALVEAIVDNESGFDARATSRAGAIGLMQLMPQTAAALGVTDPYDPAQNIRGGTRYLRGLLERFGGNVELAIAAYNAGPAAIEKYGGLPPYAETKTYLRNVLASYAKYRARMVR